MAQLKNFWVSHSGSLHITDDETGKRQDLGPDVQVLTSFLDSVTRLLHMHELADNPCLSIYDDGTFIMSAQVLALTAGSAVDIAKAAFEDVIEKAGGTSDLADGDHPAWGAAQIEFRYADMTVRELDLVPA